MMSVDVDVFQCSSFVLQTKRIPSFFVLVIVVVGLLHVTHLSQHLRNPISFDFFVSYLVEQTYLSCFSHILF